MRGCGVDEPGRAKTDAEPFSVGRMSWVAAVEALSLLLVTRTGTMVLLVAVVEVSDIVAMGAWTGQSGSSIAELEQANKIPCRSCRR
jgi:hypothetical protein